MASTLSTSLLLTVPLAPLAGSLIAGLAGKVVGRRGAHFFTILGVLIAFICSAYVLAQVAGGARYNATLYQWMVVGKLVMEVGFLVDGLTVTMMLRGHLRVPDGARLHHRLHGRRPGLPAVFRLHQRCSPSPCSCW